MEVEDSIGGSGSSEPTQTALHRGTNQSGMRDHNQRVVLSLVRQYGSLSKSDISRMTRLSAQTASVIMRELEEDGLLLRGEPQRGKIGQPSIPMSFNPDGAFFFGLKIGRRSAEMVLIDFVGRIRAMRAQAYDFPTPDQMIDFAVKTMKELTAGLSKDRRQRIAGLGIAMPFELWNWADQVGAPRDIMDTWRTRDIRGELQKQTEFPVYLQNDATSACGAELVFGKMGTIRDFIYFYIGAFAGGGIVLNGRLHVGTTGNAGALGSMPVPGIDGRTVQLIDIASLSVLEQRLKTSGIQANFLWTSPEDWSAANPESAKWLAEAGRALAYAIVSASAVFDFEAAVIDGWMPESIRSQLVEETRAALARIDVEGLQPPAVRSGTVGVHARAIGGASLPMSERFLAGTTALGQGPQ